MISTTVILTNTANETYWAIDYYKKNQIEKVIILTPNLESQLILKRKGLPFSSIYEVESFDLNKKYNPENNPNANIFKVTFETVVQIERLTKHLNLTIYGHNLFKILGNNLAFIYPDLFHSYNTYKNIVAKWKPKKIYISSNIKESYVTGQKDDIFSLACYIKYYFNDRKIKLVTYQTKLEKKIYSVPFKRWLLFLSLILKKYYFKLINFSKLKIKVDKQRKYVLMETGGIITSYYYKVYESLCSKYNFILVTYKLQVHQQIPLLQKGIPFIEFNSIWNDRNNSNLEKQKHLLLKKINKISFKLKTIRDVGLNKAILGQTRLFLKANLEQTIKKIIINRQILNKFNPKLVINSHDPGSFGASLVLEARIRKIPSLLLLHGLYMEDYIQNPYSDYFAVWGKETKDYFIKRLNRNPATIFALGFPKFDEYYSKQNNNINNFKLSDRIKIGFVLNPYPPNDSYQSKFFFEFFESLNKFKIKPIINYRLHEGYNTKGIKDIAKEYNIESYDHTNKNLDTFIQENDIMISWDTTAFLWLMIYNKPIIHTSPIWSKGIISRTREYNSVWYPENSDHLIKIITIFMKNPSSYKKLIPGQQKFINDTAGTIDGYSSEKHVNLIDKLIGYNK